MERETDMFPKVLAACPNFNSPLGKKGPLPQTEQSRT